MEEGLFSQQIIQRIFSFNGQRVMIDKDLAELYGVDNKRLNEQVKRNSNRFPLNFRFQLSKYQLQELVANCDRFNSLKYSSVPPHVFTEQGVAMLSAVLHSEKAVAVSISIMEAFTFLRNQMLDLESLHFRISSIEKKQSLLDETFERVFSSMSTKPQLPHHGIFFENQLYDAHSLTLKILKRATKSVRIIDNYLDETILELFSQCNENVSLFLYTGKISNAFSLSIKKFTQQYGNIRILKIENVHDRFLIIDDSELYHFGASLKDLGKKWFAFSRMDLFLLQLLDKLPKSENTDWK